MPNVPFELIVSCTNLLNQSTELDSKRKVYSTRKMLPCGAFYQTGMKVLKYMTEYLLYMELLFCLFSNTGENVETQLCTREAHVLIWVEGALFPASWLQITSPCQMACEKPHFYYSHTKTTAQLPNNPLFSTAIPYIPLLHQLPLRTPSRPPPPPNQDECLPF